MRAIIVLLTCAFTLWAGSNTPTARSKGEHTRPAAKGTATSVPDAEIERNFRARMAKSKIAKNNFTMKASGGVVTLEGKTNVIQHKGAATRMAKSAGAREVRNKIQISDEATKKAADNLVSGRRRAQIRRSEAR